MFYFTDEIDNKGYFMFPRGLVKDKIWCNLPLASRAVFPVIGLYADKAGTAFPSLLTIAAQTGMTPKTVSTGVRGLQGVPGFDAVRYLTAKGQYAYRYRVARPPTEKGSAFPFHRAVVEAGCWARSTEAARAVYIVMRHFGFMDDEERGPDFLDTYRARNFEYCAAEPRVLIEYSGLSRQSVYNGLASLKTNFLIERENGRWKVYLVPPRRWLAPFMNGITTTMLKSEVRHAV